MDKRRQTHIVDHSQGLFTPGSLMNAGLVIAGFCVTTIIWYTTVNTKLDEHTVSIKQESTDREKIRTEFMAGQLKTNDQLNDVKIQLATTVAEQKAAGQTLIRIADELSRMASLPSKR